MSDYTGYYGGHPDDAHAQGNEVVHTRSGRRQDAQIYQAAMAELRKRHQVEFDEIRLTMLIEAGVEINPDGPRVTVEEVFAVVLRFYADHEETPTLLQIARHLPGRSLSTEGVRAKIGILIEQRKLSRQGKRGPLVINPIYIPTISDEEL